MRAPNNDPNLIEVRIESLEFLGPFHRARLCAKSLGNLHLTADFSANLVRDLGLVPGRLLPVRLPQEYLHVFPAHR